MKTFKLTGLLIVLVSISLSYNALSQATIASNAPGANRYIGFSGGQDVEFRTNNTTRMTLTQTTGRLGLGIAAPASLLHLNTITTGNLFRSDGLHSNTNRWDLYTGLSGAPLQRYSLFVNPNTGDSPFMVNQQANYGHFHFITAVGTNGVSYLVLS